MRYRTFSGIWVSPIVCVCGRVAANASPATPGRVQAGNGREGGQAFIRGRRDYEPAGSVTVNVDPVPRQLSTVIVP
jgi:hypothetical protein